MLKYNKLKWSELFEKISPIILNPKKSSITISLSKRFILFDFLNKITKNIEDDPHLNYLSILKYYKVLGNLLTGSIHELHRDRNKKYFKDFFIDNDLYILVKTDLERVYKINNKLNLTITKRGIIIYDNYKINDFNMLLLTTHSGTWVPENIKNKQLISNETRFLEEDIAIDRIYSDLVLKKSGIWIDNKMSRFACDYNRTPKRAIYNDHSESWIKKLWKTDLTKNEKQRLMKGYEEFYFILEQLIVTYKFNIIFDGHSMRDAKGRPDVSFGVKFVPDFYMPIIHHLKTEFADKQCFCDVELNAPYSGGHILERIHRKHPNVFTSSLEINKRLYMSKNRKKVKEDKILDLSEKIFKIFGNF
ncbi:N-formylglutamate amidohydrolase [archaeon]|jgi:N-formylglutamate amidohydrolase|nr:N-formylglutamate amidohydrolase [archaeon]MBT4351941.1 N-formylglutamate amidohydrolase [archaeon]MBT4646670.1 N-formylglutamate amidohydrolase [archaeon]MBT6821880.1 N-formylglutamate amidohydrolase [archaeon]MBT7392290.1 N-formylglutamate amidohydrolase [archaeon]